MATQHNKAQKNLRLSPEARRLLALLATADGIGESAVVELIVRKEARARGFLEETWRGEASMGRQVGKVSRK